MLDKWSGENAVRIEGMVWKREIAPWKEGLADKRREEKGRSHMVVNLWFMRTCIGLGSDDVGNCGSWSSYSSCGS